MSIPIANPVVSSAAREAVDDVLQSGMLADGEEVRQFEREFAAYIGSDHAVATANGTIALQAMLEASGIGKGDEVLTSPFSFIASANAVVHAGGTPVFADVDPETFNLDPTRARDALTENDNIAAIMPVHLYGLPAAMDELREIAEEQEIHLFEDAAQAHGAAFKNEQVGSIGDAAAFSFYPTKNMTTGEGGIVTTDDQNLAERLRRLVDHGRSHRYTHESIGYNFRMTNIAAAIGREQLQRLPNWIEERRENATMLTDRLSNVPGLRTPHLPVDRDHTFHQYTLRVDDRDAVVRAMTNADVGYGIYYPETIPGQPAYGERRGWPVAECLSREVLSVPVHPDLDDSDISIVADSVTAGVTA